MPASRRNRKAAEPSLGVEVVALLEYGRALIERGHTRGAYARDRHGHKVLVSSERAVRFCAAAAVIRAEIELFDETWEELDAELPEGIDGTPRLLVALAHLNVACLVLTVAPLLVGIRAPLAPAVERLFAGPGRQIVDRTNDQPFVRKKEVLTWFDTALRLADPAHHPRPQPKKDSP